MKREVAFLLSAIVLALVIGCAGLGIPIPQTFNQKLFVAYAGVSTVVTTATTLVQAKVITGKDGKNVAAQADNVKDALDIADQVHQTDPAAGEAKLTAALTALQALKTYLCTKQPAGTGGCP